MATIASLLVRVGADAAQLRSELGRSSRLLQDFARNAGRLSSQQLFGGLANSARFSADIDLITNRINRFRQTAALSTNFVRQQFDKGLIDRGNFERQMNDINRVFNEKLRGLIPQAQALGGFVGQRVVAGILGELRNADFNKALSDTRRLSVAGDAIKNAGDAITRDLTLPIVGAGVAVAKFAGDFQAQMNRVRAVVDDSAQHFDELRAVALDLGTKTKFSPTELAEGIAILGQAGARTADIMALLPPIINLATIENLNFADSSLIVTRGLQAFSLGFRDAGLFTDKLVKASLEGVVSVTELANAFKYMAPISKAAGQNLSFVLATAVKLADAGQAASIGGTAIRNVIARLVNPSRQAAQALQDLHIKAIDPLTKKLIPLPAILDQLAKKNVTIGQLFRIFGQRAAPGASALLDEGVSSIVELAAKLDLAKGEAQKVADIQFQGLNAQLTLLKNNAIALAIAVGDTGLLNSFTNIVKKATDLVHGLSSINPALLLTGARILGLVAIIGPLISLVGRFTVGFATLRIALLTLGIGLGTFTGVGLIVVGVLTALGIALEKVAEKAIEGAIRMGQFGSQVASLNAQQAQELVTNIESQLKNLQDARNKLDAEAKKKVLTPRISFLGTPIFDKTVDPKTVQQLKELDAAIEETNGRLKVARDALQQKERAEKEANDVQARTIELMKQLGEATAGAEPVTAPGAAFNALRESVRSAIRELDLVERSTRGAVDREEQLAGPLERVRGLYDEILARVDKVLAKGQRPDSGLLQLALELQRAIAVATAPDLTQLGNFRTRASEILTRIDAIKKSTKDIVLQQILMRQPLRDAKTLEDDINQAIEQNAGNQKVVNALIQIRDRLLRSLPTVSPVEIIDPDSQTRLERLREQFLRVQADLDAAVANKDVLGVKRAQDGLIAIDSAARGLAAGFSKKVQEAIASGDPEKIAQATAAWKIMVGVFRDMNIQLDGVSSKTQKVLNKLHAIANLFNAFTDLLGTLGVVSDSLNEVAAGIDKVSNSLDKLAELKAKSISLTSLQGLGGIASLVSGGISILKGIGSFLGIGKDKDKEELLAANNRALRELTLSINASAGGLGNIARVQGILNRPVQSEFLRNLGIKTTSAFTKDDINALKDFFKNKIGIDALNDQLKHLGITFQDLQAAANALGISLVDAKGKFRPEALAQLNQAAGLAAEGLTKFSNSIQNQLDIADVRTKLTKGTVDTADSLNNLVTVLKNAAPGLASFIGDIDTTTAEGRKRLRTQLLALIDAIQAGQLKLADFGQFGSADEVLQFIGQFADALNSATDAANNMASDLNVPTGFRRQLREFQSQLQEGLKPPTLPPGSPLDRTPVTLSPLVTAVETSQERAAFSIVGAIQSLQIALTGQPLEAVLNPQAPSIGSGLETTAGSLAGVLEKLLNELSGAATTVAPDVKKLIDVLGEVFSTQAAASIRGIQEAIVRKAPVIDLSEVAAPAFSDGRNGARVEINIGEVNINGANKTAQEQWRDIKNVARQEAAAKFGNTSRWGEVP